MSSRKHATTTTTTTTNTTAKDPTAEAYASIAAKLASWTSPPRRRREIQHPRNGPSYNNTTNNNNNDHNDGTTLLDHPSSSSLYPSDSVVWMQRDMTMVDEDKDDVPTTTTTMTNTTTRDNTSPSTTPTGQRTPIVSNHAPSTSTSTSTSTTTRIPTLPLALRTTQSLFSTTTSQAHEYRRHYEILLQYTLERRQCWQRWELLVQQPQVQPQAPQDESSSLAQDERQLELEYLWNLAAFCTSLSYDNDEGHGTSNHHRHYHDETPNDDHHHQYQYYKLQANAWSLLATLRSLGRDFFLWDPDRMPVDHNDNDNDTTSTSMTTTRDTTMTTTPAQLVQDLYDSTPALQRRRSIRTWLQQQQQQQQQHGGGGGSSIIGTTTCGGGRTSVRNTTTTSTTMTPRTAWPDSLQHLSSSSSSSSSGRGHAPHKISRLDPDAPLLVADNHQNNNKNHNNSASPYLWNPLYGKDGEREQAMLEQCLKCILAGRMDQACALCEQYGQPWRCAAWTGGQWQGVDATATTTSTSTTTKSGLRLVGNANRALWKRTCWKLAEASGRVAPPLLPEETAIYAMLSNHLETCLVHGSLRSWESCLYAGMDASLQRAEEEHIYSQSSHTKNRAEEEHLQATARHGRNEQEILQWLESSPFAELRVHDPFRECMAAFLVGHEAVLEYVLSQGHNIASTTPPSFVRFLTHLVLYLDSLSASTTPLPWHANELEQVKNNLLHLYLFTLSSHATLWRLMTLYASLLPEEMMLDVYPAMLVPMEDDNERAMVGKQIQNLFGPGVDVIVLRQVVRLLRDDEQRQMRSITWLCHCKAHWGDALICTNALFRQWLLSTDDQISKALVFMEKFLPDEVVTEAELASSEVDDDDAHMFVLDDDRIIQLERARLEFGALVCYLEAHKAFLHWKDVMDATPPSGTSKETSTVMDKSALNATEKEIAASMEKRAFQRQKQEDSRRLIEAADAARDRLMQVLQYDGGWLIFDENAHEIQSGDQEEVRHIDEVKTLHNRYLPQTVFLLHNLCDETATWVESSLDEAVAVLGEDALSMLDRSEDSTSSPLSPLYWARHAMSLANLVASDEYAIQDAFSETDEHHFADLMAETEVREMQYQYQSGR